MTVGLYFSPIVGSTYCTRTYRYSTRQKHAYFDVTSVKSVRNLKVERRDLFVVVGRKVKFTWDKYSTFSCRAQLYVELNCD
jgi:hypothetical protein